ncbi:MAG: hypothetical protein WKG00_10065 [Polyangiaceae bacterium]
MSIDHGSVRIIDGLSTAGVEYIVVGMTAAVLLGAPAVTFDLDIVHRRSDANVDRLLAWLLAHGAYHRLDLANRKLPPTREPLLGGGHLNLQTDAGKLDVLCELGVGEGYDEIHADSVDLDIEGHVVRVLDLPRLIAVKARANRPKDRAVLPLLLATLDERTK